MGGAGTEPQIAIRRDDVLDSRVVALVRAHLRDMRAISPPGSVHALGLEALRSRDVTVWSAWVGHELAGCGALKALPSADPAGAGEIKTMHTRQGWRGRGVGAAVLNAIVDEARRRAYVALYLETGSTPAFAGARSFYARHGFVPSGPFGAYRSDPHSAFMRLSLAESHPEDA
jgi:putative acetyltransferase